MKITPIRLDVLLAVTATAMALCIGSLALSGLAGFALPVFTLSRWDYLLQEQDKPTPAVQEHIKAGTALLGLAIVLALMIRWGNAFFEKDEILAAIASVIVGTVLLLGGTAGISEYAMRVWKLPPRY